MYRCKKLDAHERSLPLYYVACAVYLASFVLPAVRTEPWALDNCGAVLLFGSCQAASNALRPVSQGIPQLGVMHTSRLRNGYLGLLCLANIPMIIFILSKKRSRGLGADLCLVGGTAFILPAGILFREFAGPAYFAWSTAMLLACAFRCSVRFLRKDLGAKRVRYSASTCASCGYDLRGQIQPRCPECGSPFDLRTSARSEPL